MSGIEIDTEGITQVSANLKEFGSRATDARPAMRKVRKILEEGERKNFRTGGAYFGDEWDALSPGTLARRARLGQGTKPLVATGALQRSLSGGKGKRTSATKTMAKVGTSVWYGVFQQAGTKGAGHGTSSPRRQVVGMTKHDERKAERVIEKFLMTGQVF